MIELKKIKEHYEVIKDQHMRDWFVADQHRTKTFSMRAPHVFLDFSKNLITEETLGLLLALAEQSHVKEKVQAMFAGQKINTTEHRAVLHIALRNRSNTPIMVDGCNVMDDVNRVLNKMRTFVDQVRTGEWQGYTGKSITDIVNIGIGGSDLGPKMVTQALKFYGNNHLNCHFVSNIDATQIVETLKPLDPETTLFVVASKTFTTLETLTNANTAKSWFLSSAKDKASVAKHFVALSTNAAAVQQFGIDTNHMFEFWDWVGGRYSVWSSIGLSIALSIGMDKFEKFLQGAHDMDQHFLTAPLDKNMPIILALLSIWYRNFFDYETHAVLPYEDYLAYLPAYLQQLTMESNGKRVDLNGQVVDYKTSAITWGGKETDAQHSFHQLLHQGTSMVPVDFIVALNSLNPVGEHHALLFANCLAQSQALLLGKTEREIYKELIAKGINETEAKTLAVHKEMPGNRPSNTLIVEKLTPESLGALIALYEHKTAVQSFIWNINAFDQWGVELGKQLANKIGPDLEGGGDLKDYDASTAALIEMYRKQS